MAHQTYMALNDKYLADGERLLAEEDYSQAAEKFWGAVAEAVKAISATKGWQHSSHRDLLRVINRLFQETGDRDLPTLFSSAQSLHANFYENFAPGETVTAWADNAKRLVVKLQALA